MLKKNKNKFDQNVLWHSGSPNVKLFDKMGAPCIKHAWSMES